MEQPGVDTGRHAELHPRARDLEAARSPELLAHRDRGAAGPCFVTGPGEQQQERVAAELQEAPALGVRDREQLGEAAPDAVGEVLGTDLSALGQPLREIREARDVDERDGSLDLLIRPVDVVGDPVDDEPRAGRARGSKPRTPCE